MTAQTTTLTNGLRVVSQAMPDVETVSLGVWVGAGARDENRSQHGISHLLEHMAFKGTLSRSALEIAEEIEARGGEINAATSLETTAYYARMLKGDDDRALDILADILQHSLFDEEELSRERDVIIQEIAASQDSPDDLVFDLAQDVAFPDQALGRTILGTPESVKSTTPDDLRSYLGAYYRPRRMVVSAAGAVNHDALCRHAEALFSELDCGDDPRRSRAQFGGGICASDKPFEQCHLVIGFEGPAFGSDDFFVSQVMSGLFGGSMSSRLFQEVREKRGLCYSIYSSAWGLSDCGLMCVHAATGSELMSELIDVVCNEFARLAEGEPQSDEVARAKAQLKAGLLIGLESSAARAEQMARHLLTNDRLIPKEEIVERIDAVGAGHIRALAERTLSKGPVVSVVGAGHDSKLHAARTRDKFALCVA